MTITKGDKLSGLDMLKNSQLKRFVEANKTLFVYLPNHDAAVYIGADMEIPDASLPL